MLVLVILVTAMRIFLTVRRHLVIGPPGRSVFAVAVGPLRSIGIVSVVLFLTGHGKEAPIRSEPIHPLLQDVRGRLVVGARKVDPSFDAARARVR